jgi:hypothetical protein
VGEAAGLSAAVEMTGWGWSWVGDRWGGVAAVGWWLEGASGCGGAGSKQVLRLRLAHEAAPNFAQDDRFWVELIRMTDFGWFQDDRFGVGLIA